MFTLTEEWKLGFSSRQIRYLSSQHGYLKICHRVNSGINCAKIRGRTKWAGKTEGQDNPKGPFAESLYFILFLFLNKIQTKQAIASQEWRLTRLSSWPNSRQNAWQIWKTNCYGGPGIGTEHNTHHPSILSHVTLIPSSLHPFLLPTAPAGFQANI